MELNDHIGMMWVAYRKAKMEAGIEADIEKFEAWVLKDYPILCKLVFKHPQNVCEVSYQPDCNCGEKIGE